MELPEVEADQVPVNPAPADDGLSAVYGVPVRLTVEVGQRIISIGEAADIAPGQIMTLERQADQPLDVLLNGRIVAKGEVVVIDNELAVRVTEVVDADAPSS